MGLVERSAPRTLTCSACQHQLQVSSIRTERLKGTYIDALPELVQSATGRIHTSWEQAVAATGRLSSTDPNLQNIDPHRARAKKFAGIRPPPGYVLVSADYSQIELRVLAHLSARSRAARLRSGAGTTPPARRPTSRSTRRPRAR